MRICILMGSPRLNGNTVELVKPFMEELKSSGAEAIEGAKDFARRMLAGFENMT